MTFTYKAAVLHTPRSPLTIETVEATELAPDDVLVRITRSVFVIPISR